MNNGKLTVTKTAVSYDISASTTITLRNTGEEAISLGFGDLDSSFTFGDGIILEAGETFTIGSSDAKRGDGTFYAVTKDTPNSIGYLAYASDGGVAPALIATPSIEDGADDVAIDAVPSVEFSNDVAEGYSLFLFDPLVGLVAGTPSVEDNTITFTPDADLDNETSYVLVRSVTDDNGKKNSGMISFTTVAA